MIAPSANAKQTAGGHLADAQRPALTRAESFARRKPRPTEGEAAVKRNRMPPASVHWVKTRMKTCSQKKGGGGGGGGHALVAGDRGDVAATRGVRNMRACTLTKG